MWTGFDDGSCVQEFYGKGQSYAVFAGQHPSRWIQILGLMDKISTTWDDETMHIYCNWIFLEETVHNFKFVQFLGLRTAKH